MTQRSYWIGLPVGVTVRDDGSISVEVDMSEAPAEMNETWGESEELSAEVTETQILTDMAIVDAHPASWVVSVQPAVAEMKCPARYDCDFRTFEIPLMCAHLANPDEKHGDV